MSGALAPTRTAATSVVGAGSEHSAHRMLPTDPHGIERRDTVSVSGVARLGSYPWTRNGRTK
jgi:hypothetical protein